ncbi:PepSY domain-containing protein [Acidovorax lacteus]|uniref:PepSY domain-containing protein n=1 Tax=Acidovorax lacteus TaxID=1924988 RepID=A0ABP8L8A0_9BURK
MNTKSLLAGLTLCLGATAAMAGPTCNVPKDQWMKEADFKAQLEKQGYQIRTFKVSKGQCYEIYGLDKAGKKVEIYFNPATAAVLESK